ncbi:hypothetical protein S40293_06817, partial [Stachybotrys chartarum IBT 40293]
LQDAICQAVENSVDTIELNPGTLALWFRACEWTPRIPFRQSQTVADDTADSFTRSRAVKIMTVIKEREADDESLSSSVGDEVIQETGNKRKNDTEVLGSFDGHEEEEEQEANAPKQSRHRTRPTEALKPLAFRFKSESELQRHSLQTERCQAKSSTETIDRFDSDQRKQLGRRTKDPMNKTEESKWTEVYRILFPNVDTIPTPYYDYDLTGPAQFIGFFQHEFPSQLMRRLEMMPGLDTETMRDILDVCRTSQHEVWRRWQSTRPEASPEPATDVVKMHPALQMPIGGNSARGHGQNSQKSPNPHESWPSSEEWPFWDLPAPVENAEMLKSDDLILRLESPAIFTEEQGWHDLWDKATAPDTCLQQGLDG